MNNKGWMPTRKVQAGGVGTAVMTIVAWLAVEFGGVEIPAHVATASSGLVTLVIQWLTNDVRSQKEIENDVQG